MRKDKMLFDNTNLRSENFRKINSQLENMFKKYVKIYTFIRSYPHKIKMVDGAA